MDDYHGLSFQFSSISWHNPRPVFYFLAPFFAHLGLTGYYLLVLFLVILSAAAVFRFVQKFFSCNIPIEWIFLYGVLVFSFPFIIDVSKFLGIIINLCSALFALISMFSLLKGYRENKTSFFILAALFYTLSLFTKEDFILPNILLIAYLFLFEKIEIDINLYHRKIKLFLFSAYTIISIIALALFNKYIVHSVFTGMSTSLSAPYAVNLAFSSVFKVYMHYLISNVYSIILTISALLIFILCLFFTAVETRIKLFFLLLIILSLIMPYSVLPNHTAYFYICNWLPWQSAVIVFGLFFLTAGWNKQTKYIFVAVFSILLIPISYPHRNYTSVRYEADAQRNKNMVSTLIYYKKKLNQESYVGVINVTHFATWLIGNGDYFRNNLGLTPRWLVFVDNNSDNITQIDSNKQINLLDSKKICDFPSMKYLHFMPDGKGMLNSNCHTD